MVVEPSVEGFVKAIVMTDGSTSVATNMLTGMYSPRSLAAMLVKFWPELQAVKVVACWADLLTVQDANDRETEPLPPTQDTKSPNAGVKILAVNVESLVKLLLPDTGVRTPAAGLLVEEDSEIRHLSRHMCLGQTPPRLRTQSLAAMLAKCWAEMPAVKVVACWADLLKVRDVNGRKLGLLPPTRDTEGPVADVKLLAMNVESLVTLRLSDMGVRTPVVGLLVEEDSASRHLSRHICRGQTLPRLRATSLSTWWSLGLLSRVLSRVLSSRGSTAIQMTTTISL